MSGISFDGPKNLVFNPGALDNMLNSTTGDVGKHMRKIGLEIQLGARAMAPKDTGRLAASISVKHTRLTSSQKVVVGSDVRYAYVQHEGSKPHIIVPNHQHVLHFNSRGRGVYTRVVHHPGFRGKRYLTIPMARVVRG